MTLQSLIASLEAATGPDRELDAEIAEHIGIRFRTRRAANGKSKGREWFVDAHGGIEEWAAHPPHYTASIDAALPEEMIREMWISPQSGKYHVLNRSSESSRAVEGIGHTEALARRIAALKARLS